MGIFFGVQLTMYSNFVVERLHIEAHELGGVEALREVPGFLNALFIAAVMHLAPPVVSAVAAPLVGGLVWYHFGYEVIFLAGAAVALVSLVVTRWVDADALLRAQRRGGEAMAEVAV